MSAVIKASQSTSFPMAFAVAPGVIEMRDYPLPPMGPEDIKIRVHAVTLCGSDLHIFKGAHPSVDLPIPVGHEVAGEVVEVGEAVSDLRPGDRVAVEPVIACGACHFCIRGQYHLCQNISFQYRRGQGAITPYFIAPERWVHRLPEGMRYTEGALLEPLAVAVHAVKKSQLPLGAPSAVFGAGAIGLLLLQVIRACGGGQTFMIDVNPNRLQAALDFGAAHALDNRVIDTPEYIYDHTGQLGVPRSYEAVGLEITLLQALQSLRKGGVATLVGLFEKESVHLPPNLFVQKEAALVGSQGYNWDFQTAITLVSNGQIDLAPLITHQLPFEHCQEAFELLMDPNSKAIKVALVASAS